MIIGLGADPFGVDLKEAVKKHLEAAGHKCVDLGGSSDQQRAYFDVAHELAEKAGLGHLWAGVLVCGMGMAIVANKLPRVYAAVCEDAATAARARSINNANVLTLGGMVTTPFKAKETIDAFLATEFKSGWDEEIQAFLDQSMVDIHSIESDEFKWFSRVAKERVRYGVSKKSRGAPDRMNPAPKIGKPAYQPGY